MTLIAGGSYPISRTTRWYVEHLIHIPLHQCGGDIAANNLMDILVDKILQKVYLFFETMLGDISQPEGMFEYSC